MVPMIDAPGPRDPDGRRGRSLSSYFGRKRPPEAVRQQ